MAATIIINLADPHITDKRPRSRKDDFLETQYRKLNDVLKLAGSIVWDGEKTLASAITISGDIFHQPQGRLISRKLDTRLLSLFRTSPCPIAVISGNHDLDHGRQESLREHPLGSLVASGLVKLTQWPEYLLVGTEAPVIITGRQYTTEGPSSWLVGLGATEALIKLKREKQEQTGKQHSSFVMTHCHWGEQDANLRGDPVVGYHRVAGTGVDAMAYGHPHTFDGTVNVGSTSITGPGAFVRGTLAEHDVNRKPMIAVYGFYPDGTHKVMLVPIPHEPAEKVFDLVQHSRVKQEKQAEEKFIQKLQQFRNQATKPEEILEASKDKVTPRVLELFRYFYAQAEHEVAT